MTPILRSGWCWEWNVRGGVLIEGMHMTLGRGRALTMSIFEPPLLDHNSTTASSTSTVIMSKAFVPSRNLLQTFSRGLRRSEAVAAQCRQLRTLSRTSCGPTTQAQATQTTQQCTRRPFTTSMSRGYKSVQEAKSRYRSGVGLLPSP